MRMKLIAGRATAMITLSFYFRIFYGEENREPAIWVSPSGHSPYQRNSA